VVVAGNVILPEIKNERMSMSWIACKQWIKKPFSEIKLPWSSRGNLTALQQRILELENELAQSKGYMERVKSGFLKNLYHEIRTPLNAIMGFSELIKKHQTQSSKNDVYTRYLQESCNRFLAKIDHLVEAAFIQEGDISFENCPLQPYSVLTEVFSYFSLHQHIHDKSVDLRLAVDPELRGLTVFGDRNRMQQVISNLLFNAAQNTSSGEIVFGYTLERTNMLFFVKDTGAGDLQGRENVVYAAFGKEEAGRSSNEGMGLGLTISQQLVEYMGGKMWYQSNTRKGTAFYFTLPFMPAPLHTASGEGLVSEAEVTFRTPSASSAMEYKPEVV